MFESLLSLGYFPKELPPAFNTEKFGDVFSRPTSTAPQSFINGVHPNVKVDGRDNVALCSEHNIARYGMLRRTMKIPNPIYQYNLCREITRKYRLLLRLFKSSHLSISKPVRDTSGKRAIKFQYKLNMLPILRAHISSSSRYLVVTDISEFYPSVYTHSVPWAIYGKKFAKKYRNPKLLGNAVDKWIRNSQGAQTKGIPIGPDTSLIIAETILCAVDKELQREVKKIKGFRSMDDYEFGVRSYKEAEELITILQSILNGYELELNESKTNIIELPKPFDLPWATELKNLDYIKDEDDRKVALFKFLDRSLILAKENPDKWVLNFSIGLVKYRKINVKYWQTFQNYLFQCVMVEPGTFNQVIKLLINAEYNGYNINVNTIDELINHQIERNYRIKRGSEIANAVWALIHWGLTMDSESAKMVSEVDDPVVSLMVLDANSRGLTPNGLNTSLWGSDVNEEGLYGKNWLVVYEARFKNWLSPTGSHDPIIRDANFNYLRVNDVSFYDPNRL